MTVLDSARVGVVTGEATPDLTDDGRALAAALRDRGAAVDPVVWTDDSVDWTAYDAAVVRSCWEYHTDPAAFRAWLDRVERAGVAVRNPPEAIRWNAHKFYLRDLADRGVSTPETAWIERGSDADLGGVLDDRGWTEAVVKPAVGTSSAGVWRTTRGDAASQQERFADALADGDLLVQAFAPEIADGERSFVCFGGEFAYATNCVPTADDFRAHPNYGATPEPYDPVDSLVSQAERVLDAAADALGRDPADFAYARVDGVERDGDFLLLELELIEPYLSLDAGDRAVDTFADAIEAALGRVQSPGTATGGTEE